MSYEGYRKPNPKTPPAQLAASRERMRKDPRRRVWKKAYDLAKYGISERDLYFMRLGQGGVCKACKCAPRGKGHCGKLHIDHDHTKKKGEPGFIRGLLCTNCNHALGHVRDNPDILRALAAYLGNSCAE